METCYSFPNIDRSNNCSTYSPNLDPLWFDIIIPEGSYHVEDMNEFISLKLVDKATKKLYTPKSQVDNVMVPPEKKLLKK